MDRIAAAGWVAIQLQVLAAGFTQGVGQAFETLAFTHRITFAAHYQDRQAWIDLREIGRFTDLLQAAEQVDPQLVGAAEPAQWVVDVLVDLGRVAAEPVESGAIGCEGLVE